MRPEEWIISGDTGTSSKTIWAVMMNVVTGKEHSFTFDVPHDPADFGRCYRLLNHFPAWKKRLNEVAEKFPKWKPMIKRWDELTALFEKTKSSEGFNYLLYQLIQDLEDKGMIEDGWIQTSPGSWKRKEA